MVSPMNFLLGTHLILKLKKYINF
uniref:Uncharacterized protein n=1 Tax=Rhizophora mucronata TaxID=61149 RepID=A0A2P2NX69_RHIMU